MHDNVSVISMLQNHVPHRAYQCGVNNYHYFFILKSYVNETIICNLYCIKSVCDNFTFILVKRAFTLFCSAILCSEMVGISV